MNLLNQKITIELTAKELETLAQVSGVLLGYAIPDRRYDIKILSNLFNIANRNLTSLLIKHGSKE